MARLPNKFDLSRPGNLRSGRAIAAADTSAIGRGVASLGQSISQVGGDIAARQDLTDAARAEAHFLKRKLEIENGFERDTDYSTFGTRGQSSLQQAMDEAKALFRNPGTGSRWAEMQQTTLLNATDRIGDIGRGKQQAAEQVATEDALKALRDVYIDPLTPEEDRQRARANAQATITFGLQNGLFDETTAAAFTDTYINGADFDRAKLDTAVVAPSVAGEAGTAASRAMQFFQQQGWSPAQAAGIVGNLLGESNLDPAALNPGDGTDGSDSIGIGQWNSERAAALKAFAEGQGKDWRDLDVQLAFVQHELETSESAAAQALRAAGDIDAATAAFVGYERPQGWSANDPRGAHNYAGRLAFAQQAAGQVPDYVRNLPADQRQVVLDMRAREAAAAATQQAAQATLAYEQHKDATALGILTGRVVSEAEIIGDPMLNDGDKTTLLRSFRTEQEATGAAREYLAGLAIGTGTPLNPYDADDRALGEKAYTVLQSALAPEQQQAGAMQFVQESGYVPKPVIADVRQGLSSTSPETVANAMAQAAALDATAPNALRAVDNGGDITKAAELAQTYTGMGYTPAEAAQKYIAANDPQAIKDRDALLKSKPVADALKNVTTDNIASMFPGQWVMGVGPGVGVGTNPAQAAAMVSDYKSFFEEAIVDANGDLGAAQELAKTRFQRIYGPSNLNRAGSATVVRLPTEKTYRALPDGSYDYIRAQLEEALRAEGVTFEDVSLEAYDDTDADFSNGAPARYQVSYLSNGQWQMFNLPFVADYDAALADYSEARQAQVDEAVERQQANVQDQLAREAAAANLPPADEIERLSNEAWAAGNETLSRVVGGQ